MQIDIIDMVVQQCDTAILVTINVQGQGHTGNDHGYMAKGQGHTVKGQNMQRFHFCQLCDYLNGMYFVLTKDRACGVLGHSVYFEGQRHIYKCHTGQGMSISQVSTNEI